MGCFEERYGANNRDVKDDPPSVQSFKTYFAPDTSGGSNNWRNSNTGADTRDEPDDVWANRGCPSTVLTPLTNVKETLSEGIDALEARGSTHVNVGAVWGWRLLSPEWNGVWGGDMDTNDLPLAYDNPESQKSVVIMTDGVNTMTTYTAYGLSSPNNLGFNPTNKLN